MQVRKCAMGNSATLELVKITILEKMEGKDRQLGNVMSLTVTIKIFLDC